MLAKLSKNGVFAYIMWNSTCLIGVFIIINLIDNVKPMLNCTITCPLVVLLRVMLLVYYKA
jgi:hypothetical protein